MTKMQVIIGGSGTSAGIPVIGCDCEVCTSSDPRDHRTRTGLVMRLETGIQIAIDTSPEFRLQMLRAGIGHIDHVFYTHTHADHCHGFDDLRAFYFRRKQPIHIHVPEACVSDFKERFRYAFEDGGYHGIKPQIELHTIAPDASFEVSGITVDTMMLEHGHVESCAYRVGSFAFATDFKRFRPDQLARWQGSLSVMVASGIRFREHATHSSIPETCQLFQDLGVGRGIISHICHDVFHARDEAQLPQGVQLAFDGMTIDVS